MSRPRNTTFRFIGAVFAIVAVLFTTYIPLIQPANAGISNTQAALYDAIRGGFASSGGCTNTLPLAVYLNENEMTQVDYYGQNIDGQINTSTLTDDFLGDGKDGKVSCSTIVKRYVENKYGSGDAGRQAFLKDYYKTPAVDGKFYSKVCVSAYSDPDDLASACTSSTFGSQVSDKFKTDMSNYASGIKSGNEDWLTNYATGVLVQNFNDCWAFKGDVQRTDANEYEEDNWKEKSTSEGKYNVGYLVESSFAGGYGDGKLSCSEIKSAVLENKLLDYSDSSVVADLTEDERVENVMGVFLGQDINKFVLCRATLPDAYDTFDTAALMKSVAQWIINPETHPLPTVANRNATLDVKPTAEEEAAFTDCLNSQYGDALEKAANKKINAPQTASESDESSEEADACLSSDDFLGWFACPLINMVVDVTKKIEKVITDSLKFDLATIGTNEDVESAMKETWNIFRSIATILLVIGFLIALLVKAIKG